MIYIISAIGTVISQSATYLLRLVHTLNGGCREWCNCCMDWTL